MSGDYGRESRVETEYRKLRQRTVREALRAADNYGLLFVLLLLDLLASAFTSNRVTTFIRVVLVALTLVVALRSSRVGPRATRFAWMAAGLAVVFSMVAITLNSPTWAGLTFAMMAALLLVTPVAIGKRILSHKRVTAATLFGAVSIYVIIGLLFAFSYASIDYLTQEPFFAQGSTPNLTNYIYMSYVTLTTVGYGDLTPATEYGKMLAVLEALLGQVFLVTAVARLVSLYGREEDSGTGAGGARTVSDPDPGWDEAPDAAVD